MARIPRFTRHDQPTVYHIMSRTALDGFPLQDTEKDHLMAIVAKLCKIYFVDLLGFCLMGNHFHLVVRVNPSDGLTEKEITERYKLLYGQEARIIPCQIEDFSNRLTNLGSFVKDIKQGFTKFYNKRKRRWGTFWGERFKSVIVQEGETLVNLLAYVDLNPVRAGIVDKPEDYRWSTLGYLVQRGNRDGLIDLNLGMHEWNEFNSSEIIRKYRQFVYETGAVRGRSQELEDRSQKSGVRSQEKERRGIDMKIVEKERKRNYRLSRVDVFRHRCRYFTDSGIIGSKEFVSEVFDGVKHLLDSKNERRFTPVSGVGGVYSMKRLVGAVGG
ncbi:transposase [Desulfonatronum thiodismutans]|uniref:transposase n=1 Tax=Desulfonatronum thiodismutans TaxID=159290 RepID=UPI0004ABDA0F|nr:transposase [Desulfonatronum thiodismutans]